MDHFLKEGEVHPRSLVQFWCLYHKMKDFSALIGSTNLAPSSGDDGSKIWDVCKNIHLNSIGLSLLKSVYIWVMEA